MAQRYKSFTYYQRSFNLKRDTYNNSLWLYKFINKLMSCGKKHVIDKYTDFVFIQLKFSYKRLPVTMLSEQIKKFKPVLSFVWKRMGRKHNPVPIPIHYRRQYILSLSYIIKYIKTITQRNFVDQLRVSLESIFGSIRNTITRLFASDVLYLAEARFYSHLRWK